MDESNFFGFHLLGETNCEFVKVHKVLLSSASPVFVDAFLSPQTKERKRKRKVSSCACLLTCEEVSTIQLDKHQSLQVVKEFFQSFTPFSSVKRKVKIDTVHEWLQLAHQYSISSLITECEEVIREWLVDTKREDDTPFVTVLGSLEKFKLFHLHEQTISTLAQQIRPNFLDQLKQSAHLECCFSRATMLKTIEKLAVKLFSGKFKSNNKHVAVGDVYEAIDTTGSDSRSRICLVKITKLAPDDKVAVHFLGWHRKWDSVIPIATLKPAQKNKFYESSETYRKELDDVLAELNWSPK